ncbi:uncharacterized protein I303_100008 [Kwoniella dejecticola CBS 10117]|uniref:Major facilitator superfamily (MFS) profile domain-containing protein n=1 Tax=Kwoniella dejecticola CBS 10117 TaxID=1296121 RepID=A0AAJ8KH86_9TREE
MSLLRRIRGWIFLNDPTWSEEKRREQVLVRRLDVFFMIYAAFSSIVKWLDQNNVQNAYVSGMQEDLHLYGNELNYFTTYFNIGYTIMIPFSVYLMNDWIRPNIWLPTAELLWGIATATFAAVHTAKQVYGIRFVVGFFEGTAWPGIMVLLLSWYTPSEAGKRIAIYEASTYIGSMWAGFLQAALYRNLNGAHGLSGWRWMFVVNAIIPIAFAGYGYIGIPGYPNRPNRWAFWLRDVDVETAQLRMKRIKRSLPKGWSWKAVKSLVTGPHNWLAWAFGLLGGQGTVGTRYFNLWLKSLKNADGSKRYSVEKLNLIPVASAGISVVSLLTLMSLSDRFQVQWPFILFCLLIGLTFSSVLAVWEIPDSVRFASYFIMSIPTVFADLQIAWYGTLLAHSAEERSFMVAFGVVSMYCLNAGVPLSVWPATEAPHWRIGWKYSASCWAGAIVLFFCLVWYERNSKLLRARNAIAQDDEASANDQIESDDRFDSKTPVGEEDQPVPAPVVLRE